jgi:POT family proton-dependent oligopeptide transporter
MGLRPPLGDTKDGSRDVDAVVTQTTPAAPDRSFFGHPPVLLSPLWLVAVFVVQTVGELLISPVGLSVATQLAPPRETSQIMGVWYLSLAVGAALSGELAALYGVVNVPAYYALLGLLLLATAAIIALLRRPLLSLMEGVR